MHWLSQNMATAVLYLIPECPRYFVCTYKALSNSKDHFYLLYLPCLSWLHTRNKDHGLKLILLWWGKVGPDVESRIFFFDVVKSCNFWARILGKKAWFQWIFQVPSQITFIVTWKVPCFSGRNSSSSLQAGPGTAELTRKALGNRSQGRVLHPARLQNHWFSWEVQFSLHANVPR